LDADRIFAGLNDEQRAAVEATRGPVCILAGAGTGKTTTITRRIAWQVASAAFGAQQIVAVTFTEKAAGELRSRLAALGVDGVRASTFHSAALALLRRFSGDPGRILSTKALLLRQIGNRLPAPYKFRPAGDLATEIEWAKNRRLTPATYIAGLGGHEPPLPVDLAHRVFRDYERRKAEASTVDFEDLLEGAVRLLEEDESVLELVRENWRAFTVDEYQDVNLLQQALLDAWLGGRDELCAVGDDYQSIYGFTGASPEWLLALPRRFANVTTVRLERNYRSTPQVLGLANRLAPKLGGAEKTLRATCGDGPEPEVAFDVDLPACIRAAGLPLEEQAILVRTNARAADVEELLHEAGIPFQGASLLARDAARRLLKALPREAADAGPAVRAAAVAHGWLESPPEKLGEREHTRQADLARLVRLAESFDGDVVAFVAMLHERFGASAGRGVHLLTLHRAKGLEFEAVYLPFVEEGELPIRRGDIDEERRLFYVGLTRAKRRLVVTWSAKPSRFLAELGVSRGSTPKGPDPAVPETPVFAALRAWRAERAKADEVPAYVVFHNSTLAEIAVRSPRTLAELGRVPGVGPTKLERYGGDVLAALSRAPTRAA
jgi:DNA helicase-2/ATP-dependent DNA helicase PcrA